MLSSKAFSLPRLFNEFDFKAILRVLNKIKFQTVSI